VGFFETINGFLGQANGVLDSIGDTLGTFQQAKGSFGSPNIQIPTGGFAGGGFTGFGSFLSQGAPGGAGMDTSTVVLIGGLAVLVVLVLVMLL
jgi:hypothetical protein